MLRWRDHSDNIESPLSRKLAPLIHLRAIDIKPGITILYRSFSWWRHQMETISALLALCAGNSPVTSEFPAQRPVTRSFDVCFDPHLNKRLDKRHRAHYDVIVMSISLMYVLLSVSDHANIFHMQSLSAITNPFLKIYVYTCMWVCVSLYMHMCICVYMTLWPFYYIYFHCISFDIMLQIYFNMTRYECKIVCELGPGVFLQRSRWTYKTLKYVYLMSLKLSDRSAFLVKKCTTAFMSHILSLMSINLL